MIAALSLAVAPLALLTHVSQAAVTLNANDTFVVSDTPTGDLTVSGDLSVVQGIDYGTATDPSHTAVQFYYFGGIAKAAMFDLTDPLGTFQWRDNLVATARDKMKLDGGNLLTLYKSDGTAAGILLNPNTGQIHLSGTGSGIYAGGNPVFTVDASGNLVFGNRPFSLSNTSASSSSSSGALTVAGGMGVAMDSYINGIRVGRGGGNSATNTAYGVSTLQANTTGSSNTATGYYSLGMNTSGYSNTATGYYALTANTTGGNNTAAGSYALRTNTTGYSNTAAGSYSLGMNTSGYSNTATGYYALAANTTGGNNTAAGSYALRTNTTGSSNTAAGYYSLMSNTTGNSNDASGYYALGRNTTGYYNAASGSYALGGNTTGNANTAAGYGSLQYNTTGSSNVAIGSGAAKYQANGTSALTDPDNSIYIGTNARGFSNLDQNSIVIGTGAIGEGANTTVIGSSNTVSTHLYGTVNASAFTINHSPVITPSYGQNSVLTGGATLAIGTHASATQQDAIAIGTDTQALGWGSIALGNNSYCADIATESIAMTGGRATNCFSMAAGYGEANGELSMAFGLGLADGTSSIALGGFDWRVSNYPGNHSMGDNSVTLGGVGNQAMGFSSFAAGFWTKALTPYSVALGSLNHGLGTRTDTWVETDPLFELGNGIAPRSYDEPAASNRSNAITTLKNGQTTLTNKEWKANAPDPLADPDSSNDSGGEALVVEGHTRLRGKVIIEQAQGDISMGIYGP